ncbi:META domain-containing protein [Halomonas sp. GXIMD04776]|uniref:META domain-containing protein n=1 Tax=Halomonas sp. GXIMD04776 TaxID=3415605 RepID=UPI003C7FBF6E
MRLWVALLLSMVLLGGCGASPSVNNGADTAQATLPIVGPRWTLTLLGTDQPWQGEAAAYFELQPEGDTLRLSGSDGCNRLMGKAELGEGNRIAISEVISTRMACPGLAQSTQVSHLLSQAHRYLIDHDRLVLMGRDGHVLAGFKRQK